MTTLKKSAKRKPAYESEENMMEKMFKLYNKGGGKGSLEPYALYEYKG